MGDDYLDDKIEQYERKLKQAEKAGKHHKAKKYAEKLERLRAEAAEQSTDSDTDSDDDDIDSDDEADNSFALDEEPDVAPRGLKGASKLEWLGGRGAKKLVANACREAVSELGRRGSTIPCADFPERPKGPCATSNCAPRSSATDQTPAMTARSHSSSRARSRCGRGVCSSSPNFCTAKTLLRQAPSHPAAQAAARASS